jgi:RimJ/RimL family protein N-acetyltransferase
METARLTGRPLAEEDIPFVVKAWNDERVTALVDETMTEQQVRERIERWSRHRAIYGCGTELFYDRTTAQPIGWGGLQHSAIGNGERLTIGYAIAPDVWGRGYATEIALASAAYAFDQLSADDVRASILSTNTRSRRVAEKVGLSLECEINHGKHVEVIYVTDRATWSRGGGRRAARNP